MKQVRHLQQIVGSECDGLFGPKTLRASAKFFNLSLSQAAHFFGQISVETGKFTVFSENLNYTSKRLVEVFPKYFPNICIASQYANQPVAIASKVYANRMGNGDEKSGDGYRYRGRGAIQLTGRKNYEAFSTFLGSSEPLGNPDCVEHKYSFLVALWYFSKADIWTIADQEVTDSTVEQVTRKINGGLNGLTMRKERTFTFYKMLCNGN